MAFAGLGTGLMGGPGECAGAVLDLLRNSSAKVVKGGLETGGLGFRETPVE